MPNVTSIADDFPSGLAIGGVPLVLTHPGKVFYVHHNSTLHPHASDGNSGATKDRPLATIDAAVGKCVADRGDVILVLPGHVETIATAAALDLDVNGIAVIGLGRGTMQPRLDFTAAAGDVEVNADNVLIHNINFHANVTIVTL